MKPTELRIGNIVTHEDYSTETFKVKSIEIHDGKYVVNTIGGKNGSWENHISLINPVPLTEEILLKAGFKEQGGAIFLGQRYKRYVMGRNSLYSINGKSYIFAVNDRDLCEIEYIHQLQNLFFALTGEELTIDTI